MHQRVLTANPHASTRLTTRHQFSTRTQNRLHGLQEAAPHTLCQHRTGSGRRKPRSNCRCQCRTLRSGRHNHQPGIGAKLTGTHQTARCELVRNLLHSLRQSTRQHKHRIDTGQLQINRLARSVRRRLQPEPRLTSTRVTYSTNPRIRHQPQPILMRRAIDQLHQSRRHPRAAQSRHRRLTENPSRFRMTGMTLGNHRIPRCNRCRKISPRNPVVRIRKIIRTKHHHRTQLTIHRTDIHSRINRRHSPRFITRRCSRLPNLIHRSRQLRILQPRRFRQTRLCMRSLNKLVRTSLYLQSIRLQKLSKTRTRPAPHLPSGSR